MLKPERLNATSLVVRASINKAEVEVTRKAATTETVKIFILQGQARELYEQAVFRCCDEKICKFALQKRNSRECCWQKREKIRCQDPM